MANWRAFVFEDIEIRRSNHALTMSFASKVTTVLVASAASATFYQTLIALLGSDRDNKLVARTVYATLMALIAPSLSWLLSRRCACAKGSSFLAISLQMLGHTCPVLLAWSWKDWAAQADEWAGRSFIQVLVMSLFLTAVVLLVHHLPCSRRAQLAVAARGKTDTLSARLATFPGSLGLTLGFVWNNVATYGIDHVGELISDRYNVKFVVQSAYALVIGYASAFVCTCMATREMHECQPNVEGGVSTHSRLPCLYEGLAAVQTSVGKFSIQTVRFVYAWALLDTVDDWFFGVLFRCGQPSECTYEQNFQYAVYVTIICIGGTAFLHKAQLYSTSTIFRQAVALHLNAMMLTVGWAWKNFFSVFMAGTVHDHELAFVKPLLYLLALFVIVMFATVSNYVLQVVDIGLSDHFDKIEQWASKLPSNDSLTLKSNMLSI